MRKGRGKRASVYAVIANGNIVCVGGGAGATQVLQQREDG